MTFQQFHTCIAPRILLMPIFLANKLQGKIKQVIKHKSHDCVWIKKIQMHQKKNIPLYRINYKVSVK